MKINIQSIAIPQDIQLINSTIKLQLQLKFLFLLTLLPFIECYINYQICTKMPNKLSKLFQMSSQLLLKLLTYLS